MNRKYDKTSPQFKRAIHAFAFAMSLTEEIADDEERFIITNLVEGLDGEIGDAHSVVEFIAKEFDDYEDYDQICRGYYTGVWYQKMQKEDGTTFDRGFYGNDLETPNPYASFSNGNFTEQYDAKQLYAFFVPHNNPSDLHELTRDETNHIPLPLEKIKQSGKHNGLAISTCDFAQMLNQAATKQLTIEANSKGTEQ